VHIDETNTTRIALTMGKKPQKQALALAESDSAAAAETRADSQPGERLDMAI
jgi:hypothetical protein